MSELVGLSQLLLVAEDDAVVARDQQGEYTLRELRQRTASLVQALQAYPNATRWALVCDSPWAAAISLLALLHAEKHVVMPQNTQVGTLVELRSALDGVLSDMPVSLPGLPVLSPLGDANSIQQIELRSFVTAEARITLYTSGSTGEQKRIEKRFVQLDTEVVALESVWGEALAGCDIFSTVSHQHIYGLLFGVLWPLAARRTFVVNTRHSVQALMADVQKVKRAVIVSCPAHLGRMPELVSLDRIRESCRLIFSSGGPLLTRDAARVREQIGQAPVEVFGSTETGGVAWRQQSAAEDSLLWTPLPQVEISCSREDSGLMVRSPFASADAETWVSMGDRVALQPDGRFRHEGRLDRIVKVEQKRLSLPELERRLMTHDWVREAAVCVVQRASGRSILAAVVALSEQGEERLVKEGRRVVSEVLRESLSDFLERELWPKRFAYVQELPRNDVGKVTDEGLQSLFRPSALRLPHILSVTSDEASCVLELQVPDPLLFCDGHFAEKAIVPGVVQTGWVLHFGVQILQLPTVVEGMEAIKFQAILCPGDRFVMTLQWKEDRRKLTFALKNGEKTYSSGRFVLAARGG